MIILDIDKPERCGKCPMHRDGNDYCKLAHDHASFVRAKGCPIQTIKTGHWESFDLTYGRDIYKCSVCKCTADVPTVLGIPMFKYCPNCGAKMVEPQESEDKE